MNGREFGLDCSLECPRCGGAPPVKGTESHREATPGEGMFCFDFICFITHYGQFVARLAEFRNSALLWAARSTHSRGGKGSCPSGNTSFGSLSVDRRRPRPDSPRRVHLLCLQLDTPPLGSNIALDRVKTAHLHGTAFGVGRFFLCLPAAFCSSSITFLLLTAMLRRQQ